MPGRDVTNSKFSRPGSPRRKVLYLAVLLCLAVPEAGANPRDPTVVGGQASFSGSGPSLTVTNSNGAIIHWRQFSIDRGELTRFVQPSAQSAVLNRVVSADPSVLLGTLSSNGKVFLVNPAGILVGQGARIDVAGLVASTLNISNADFLAGRNVFEPTPGAGNIVNQGRITTPSGGQVYLVGANVSNDGIITTPRGEVILAAGNSVQLLDSSTPGVAVQFSAADNKAENLGEIIAASGKVGIVGAVVRHAGLIDANQVVRGENGKIYLRASRELSLDAGSGLSANGATGGDISVQVERGSAFLAGRIDARGGDGDATLPGDGRGGSVTLGGNAVFNTARVSAQGASGGAVAVEADRYIGAGELNASAAQGEGGSVSVRAASRVIQTSAETLRADGGVAGRGGTIVVESNDRVFSSAVISARGTGSGQTGGEVRVLGKDVVLLGASIDASGDAGGGTVLVGGDFQGKNPAIRNAATNSINFTTAIRADALTAGGGGKVIVWSDKDTRYAGAISARGGARAGDGGFIEVSGKEKLVFGGHADAGAPNGNPGTLLLDPKNIVIDASAGGLGSFLLADPNPRAGDLYGSDGVFEVANGNIAVIKMGDDAVALNAGAVYLFNGSTGALISTLTGASAGDQVGSGSITVLGNGNFLVSSPVWRNVNVVATSAGAVTWVNGVSGLNGAVDVANSLVGTHAFDFVGSGGITRLTNGNYVVVSPNWDNGAVTNAGAVTWGNGATRISGAVAASNSLVGTAAGSQVGLGGVTALTNGNYVVVSPTWNDGTVANLGAVTWGNGATGISGAIAASNSLVGTTANDRVGSNVVALTNGNYVVASPNWDNGALPNVGAVTWGNGATGISGAVTASNSLVGTIASDQVGSNGVTALTNGNYVVVSSLWDNGAATNVGAVTWGNGATGISGAVSTTNSLYGATANEQIGNLGVTALTNGNYVVSSLNWSNGGTASQLGAVTWGNGATGTSGALSAANSLVGSTAADMVGSNGTARTITALTNGNYVVASSKWDNGAVPDVGAVTWGNGATGISGAVSTANSLVGTTANDRAGAFGVTPLANGNYVVNSALWNNGAAATAGAVTWGNGATGASGAISASNSLVGTNANDAVGSLFSTNGVTALTNGNYVVSSPDWKNGAASSAGAVTWGNGTAGLTGPVSAANSLVGAAAFDRVGADGVTALTNGNYVVRTSSWNNGAASSAGAVTWGNGTTGTKGAISTANSLVGTTSNDAVGADGVTALSNGNYVVASSNWTSGTVGRAGAVTWANGATGVSGPVTTTNSLIGVTANDLVGFPNPIALANGNFVVRSKFFNNGGTDTGLIVVGLPNGPALANPLAFSNSPATDATITPAQITAITNTGTAVTLQANNDITLAAGSDITTVPTAGSGGAITMQAGRSIALNANVTTGNGALTLVANDTVAHGVANANRDPGAAGITMATGTSINAGSGNVSITLDTGAGLTNSTSGGIALQNLSTSGTLAVANNGLTAGSGVSFAGNVAAGPMKISSGGPVTQTGAINAASLELLGTGSYTLTNAGNSVPVLAANLPDAGSALSFSNGGAVSIGSAGSTSGITVRDLTLSAGGAITQSGPLSVAGTASFTTPSTVTLTQAGNDFSTLSVIAASAMITDTNALILGSSNLTGTLSVAAGGAVSQSGAVVAGTLVAQASGGISLNNSANQFAAASFTDSAGGNVSLSTSGALALGASSTAGAATVSAGGAITQSSPLSVGGTASFTTPSTVTLTQAGNDFSTLSVTAASATITDTNALILGSSNVTGTFNVSAGGAVSQSGPLSVGGTASFATPSTVTLTQAGNDFSTLSVTAASATITDTNALILGSSNVTDTFNVSAGGAVSQSGAIVAGTLDAQASGGISLNNSANQFAAASFTDSAGGNVSLSTSGALALGASSTAGAATVSAGGAITQSGPLSVGGTASFTTPSTVTLTQAGNDFSTLSVTAASATITDTNALILGSSNVTGTFNVSAGGAVSQSGAIVAGTLIAQASGGIILDSRSNQFGGASFVNSGGGAITVNDAAASLSLTGITQTGGGDITLVNSGALSSSGVISVGGSGNLSLTASGLLTNGASITAGGNAILSGLGIANSGDITGLSVTLDAGAGLLEHSAGAIGNGGGAGAIVLRGGDMNLAGAVNGSRGTVTLTNASGSPVSLGAGASGFGLSNTELNKINAGALIINGSPVSLDGDVSIAGAGGVTLNATSLQTTDSSLAVPAGGLNITTTGNVDITAATRPTSISASSVAISAANVSVSGGSAFGAYAEIQSTGGDANVSIPSAGTLKFISGSGSGADALIVSANNAILTGGSCIGCVALAPSYSPGSGATGLVGVMTGPSGSISWNGAVQTVSAPVTTATATVTTATATTVTPIPAQQTQAVVSSTNAATTTAASGGTAASTSSATSTTTTSTPASTTTAGAAQEAPSAVSSATAVVSTGSVSGVKVALTDPGGTIGGQAGEFGGPPGGAAPSGQPAATASGGAGKDEPKASGRQTQAAGRPAEKPKVTKKAAPC